MAFPLAGDIIRINETREITQATVKSIKISDAGSLGVTSGATELNIAKLAIGTVDMVSGLLYEFRYKLFLTQSVAADRFNLILRRATALTGSVVADWVIPLPGNTSMNELTTWDDYVSASTQTTTFYLSAQRLSGSGTLTINGQQSGTNRPSAKLMRTGYSTEFSTVP